MLHYDVMDGHFVHNISFGVPVLKSLHKTLPAAFYDVHLMISHPLQYAEPVSYTHLDVYKRQIGTPCYWVIGFGLMFGTSLLTLGIYLPLLDVYKRQASARRGRRRPRRGGPGQHETGGITAQPD